jgi:AcrR family transcriptional regulator
VPPEGLTRAAYFDAAFDLLSEHGHGGLTIAALGQRLGVTKGSFYHHFRDMPEFVDALLAHWAREHATRLIALSDAVTDDEERMELLKGIAVGLPHGAEAAIRAWSWSNDAVARMQRQVDQARLDHLTRSGMMAGRTGANARTMATIALSILIGLQQLERPARPESVEAIFAELKSWMLQPATPA